MKKFCRLFFVSILTLLVFFGCSLDSMSLEDKYIHTLNDYMVSFSDCANAFADSMEQISDKTTIPTEAELNSILSRIQKLSDVCAQISALDAPEKYSETQDALNDSMQKYMDSMKKCSELIEFYRTFDGKIHEYKNPIDGSAELQQQAEAIYAEFAVMLQQATASFHSAWANFDFEK